MNISRLPIAALLLVGCASSNNAPVEENKAAPAASQGDHATRLVEGYAAYNKNERDLSFWAEDAEYISIDDPADVHIKGRDKVMAFIQDGFKSVYSDAKIMPARVIVLDANTVLVEAVVNGTNTGPLPNGAPATNKQIGVTVGHRFTFNAEGKVQKLEAFIPQMAMMIQLGLMPPPLGRMPPLVQAPAEPEIIRGAGDAALASVLQKIFDIEFKADNLDELGTVVSDNVQVMTPPNPEQTGLEKWKERSAPFRAAFSEDQVEWVNKWVIGDIVIARIKHSAKHTGKIGPFEATNKMFTRDFLDVAKIKDGKLVHVSGYGNAMGSLKQLGLLGPPPPADAPAQK